MANYFAWKMLNQFKTPVHMQKNIVFYPGSAYLLWGSACDIHEISVSTFCLVYEPFTVSSPNYPVFIQAL
jgi:hypothetical protein